MTSELLSDDHAALGKTRSFTTCSTLSSFISSSPQNRFPGSSVVLHFLRAVFETPCISVGLMHNKDEWRESKVKCNGMEAVLLIVNTATNFPFTEFRSELRYRLDTRRTTTHILLKEVKPEMKYS